MTATAIARLMLAQVILPPRSRFVAAAPSPVLASEPSQSSIGPAQATQLAVSGQSASSMYAFLQSHRPPGTLTTGTGTGTVGGVGGNVEFLTENFSNLGPRVHAEELVFFVVAGPGGTGSDVRIDATVNLTVRGLPGTMVPGGDTVAVVSVTDVVAPKRVVVTAADMVASLRSAADGLPAWQFGGTIFGCPAYSGGTYVVAFAASATADPNITFTAGFCGIVGVSTAPAGRWLSNDTAFATAYEQALATSLHWIPRSLDWIPSNG